MRGLYSVDEVDHESVSFLEKIPTVSLDRQPGLLPPELTNIENSQKHKSTIIFGSYPSLAVPVYVSFFLSTGSLSDITVVSFYSIITSATLFRVPSVSIYSHPGSSRFVFSPRPVPSLTRGPSQRLVLLRPSYTPTEKVN